METQRYLFTSARESDTCWDIAKANDGNIYVGACCEHTPGGIGVLVKFDPSNKSLTRVADLAVITGETVGDSHAPQGKIHLSLSPSKSGFVYGSTHCTTPPLGDEMWDPWAMYMDQRRSYRGAHLFRYDPNADDIVDFGTVAPHDGVSLMMLDENVQRLFAVTFPRSHLVSWDLKGRDAVDLGRVSEHYVLAFVRYDKNTIFFSDYYGRLLSVDPEKQIVRSHDVQLIHPRYNDGMRNWMSHGLLGPDGWVYAGMYSYPNVIRFRPGNDAIVVEDLGHGLARESPLTNRTDGDDDAAVGYAFTNGTPVGLIQRNDTLFFAQVVYWGPREYCGSYIASYNMLTGEKRLVAPLLDGGFKPPVWKGVAGDDGTLYWADFDASPPSLWAVTV